MRSEGAAGPALPGGVGAVSPRGVSPVASRGWRAGLSRGHGTAQPRTPPRRGAPSRAAPRPARGSSLPALGSGGAAAGASPVSPVTSQKSQPQSVPCAKPLWKTSPSFKNESPMEPRASPILAWACVCSQPSSTPWLRFACTFCFRGAEPPSRVENQALLQNLQQLFFSVFCLLVWFLFHSSSVVKWKHNNK